MPRIMVGLLARVSTAMSMLAAFVHGNLVWVTVADAAAAGLAAYLASETSAKCPSCSQGNQGSGIHGGQLVTKNYYLQIVTEGALRYELRIGF